MKRIKWLVPLLTLVVACGVFCTDDKEKSGTSEADNKAPIINDVRIVPSSAQPGDDLEVSTNARDMELDAFELEYKWYIDGAESSDHSGKRISTDGFYEETPIYVMVRATEKKSDRTSGWKKSNTVVLGEPPPPKLGGVGLSPGTIYTDTDVSADVDYGDTDPMDVYALYYRWMVNQNVVLEGEDESTLSSGNFERGDEIFLRVSTDEGFAREYTVNSKIYTVANSPPVVESTDVEMRGDRVVVTANAYDPDGDELSFQINKAPGGTSASVSGNDLVMTVPAPSKPGSYQIRYQVSDGHGTGQNMTATFNVN